MEAHDNGFTEGIALDVNGYVSEGARAKIYSSIKDGVVYTPGDWSSILIRDVTRDPVSSPLLGELGLRRFKFPDS